MQNYNNGKLRVFAAAVAACTAVTPALSTYMNAYAVEYSLGQTGMQEDTGIPALDFMQEETDSQTVSLLLNLTTVGGKVELNTGSEEEKQIQLTKAKDGTESLQVYDKDGVLIDERPVETYGYTFSYETPKDSTVQLLATAESGYTIGYYNLMTGEVEEDTGFDTAAYPAAFTQSLYMDQEKTVSVAFLEEPETETQKDTKKEEAKETIPDVSAVDKDGETKTQEETSSKTTGQEDLSVLPETAGTEDETGLTEAGPSAEETGTEAVTEAQDAETETEPKDLTILEPETAGTDGDESEPETVSGWEEPETGLAPDGDEPLTEGDLTVLEPETAGADETETEALTEQAETEFAPDGDESEPLTEGDLTVLEPETAGADETETETMSEQTETELASDEDSEPLTEQTEPLTEEDPVLMDETHFLDMEDGISELDASAFASARLIVMTDDQADILDPEHLIATYGNLYLLQYATVEQSMNAYLYYQSRVAAVEPDANIQAAEAEEADALEGTMPAAAEVMDEADNPLAALNTMDGQTALPQQQGKVVALIDTGVTAQDHVLDRVSVIDGQLEGNGHGDRMLQAIVSQDSDVSVLSIRAMDNDGRGPASAVIAAMEYAISQNVDIINLSMYAKTTLLNSVLESEIEKAVAAGIEVVGAAGNDNADVKDYMPGRVEAAWIIGACDTEGTKTAFSNYGATVDYNVIADSTSEAAAKFTGFISAHGTQDVETGLLIFKPGTDGQTPENQDGRLYLAGTLVLHVGDEFNPETYLDDLTEYIPDGADTTLEFSDVDLTAAGNYTTIYHVEYEGSTYAVKRMVKVLEQEQEDITGEYMVSILSDDESGNLNIDTDATYYHAGDTVTIRLAKTGDVNIYSVKAYLENTEENTNLAFGQELDIQRADGENAPEDALVASYLNEDTAAYQFTMPEGNAIVAVYTEDGVFQTADGFGDDDELTSFKVVNSNICKYYNSAVSGTNNPRCTTKRLATYSWIDADGKKQTTTIVCYCMQPSAKNPLDGGQKIYSSKNNEVIEITDAALVAKGLYYLYGGPMWGATVEDSDGNKVNMKTVLSRYASTKGSTGDDGFFAQTHFIMGYLYATGREGDWNYADDGKSGPVWNNNGKAWLKSVAEQLSKLPAPTVDIIKNKQSVIGTTLDASFQSNGIIRTAAASYRATETNTAAIKLPAGVTLVYKNSDGDEVKKSGTTTIPGGVTFWFLINPNTYTDKTFDASFTTKFPVNFQAWKIVTSGKQDLGFGYRTGNKTIGLSYSLPEATASISLKKVNADGDWSNNLKGAVFTLYEGTKELAHVTIANSGYHKFSYDCKLGHTYTIKETTTPEGYVTADDITCKVTSSSKLSFQYTVKNDAAPKVKVLKKSLIDANSTTASNLFSLDSYSKAGAEFGVYSNEACTTKIGTLVSDSNGNTAALTLPWTSGRHSIWVKETKAPAGHTLNGTVRKKDIDFAKDKNSTITIEITNAPVFVNASAALATKIDKDTEGPLKGARFLVRLYDGKHTLAECAALTPKRNWRLVTDQNGNLKVDESHLAQGVSSGPFYMYNGKVVLPVGCTMTIQEETAPSGYTLDNTVRLLKIARTTALDEAVQTTKITNSKAPGLKITKKSAIATTANTTKAVFDKLSGYSVAGALFGVYTSSKCTEATKLATLKTNESGVSGTYRLPWTSGTHTVYLKELKAPAGHKLSTQVIKQTIDVAAQKGKTVNVEITDEPMFVTLKALVVKKDTKTKKVLPGVDYAVKLYDGVYTSVSDIPADGCLRTWFLTTDAAGQISVDAEHTTPGRTNNFIQYDGKIVVPVGCTLTIQERKALPNYTLDSTVRLWSVSKNAVVTKTHYNQQPDEATIEIKKVDGSGKWNDGLIGAVFDLYEETTKVASVRIEDSGYHQFDYICSTGKTYTIKESVVPEGYSQAEDVTVEITAGKTQYQYTIKNTAAPRMRITKKSGTELAAADTVATQSDTNGAMLVAEDIIKTQSAEAELEEAVQMNGVAETELMETELMEAEPEETELAETELTGMPQDETEPEAGMADAGEPDMEVLADSSPEAGADADADTETVSSFVSVTVSEEGPEAEESQEELDYNPVVGPLNDEELETEALASQGEEGESLNTVAAFLMDDGEAVDEDAMPAEDAMPEADDQELPEEEEIVAFAGGNILETPDEILSLSGYSLEGAVYGLYTDRACTEASKFATLTTDENGVTEDAALPWTSGTHTVYIKETKAPAGHVLNEKVKSVSVNADTQSGKVIDVEVADEPEFTRLDALVQKMSAKGNPISGVVFEVKLYDGKYSSVEDCPEEALKKTWYLKSDDRGNVKFDDKYLAENYAESDSLYHNCNNQVVIPVGCTVTYQEVQAPAECIMDNAVKLWEERGEKVEISRVYNLLEPSAIRMKKYDTDGKTPLAGVEFELAFTKQSEKYTADALKTYTPLLKEGETKIMVTDANGELSWENLDQGEYTITEVKTAAGHTLLKDAIHVTLPLTMTDAEAEVSGCDTSKGKHDDENGVWYFYEVLYEVTNEVSFKIPTTGGNGTWKYGIIGFATAALTGSFLLLEKRKKKKK